ncbi:MAG TPA: hypothetical protein VFW83_10065, partial [Bryobacteraceae bacterium]|nr:hypothetical protein [Bryobacteraceae bacterium]
MGILFLAALLASTAAGASIKQNGAPLRDGCDADAKTIAALPAGTRVTVGYELAGEAVPCYQVTASASGKDITGYVAASALGGLESFDDGLRGAAWLDWPQVLDSARSSAKTTSPGPLAAALRLLQSGEPSKALESIEPEVKAHPSPGLLAWAGLAASRADDSHKALAYWREALDEGPDPGLQMLYERLEREVKNDRSTEKLYGARVFLRYDPASISAGTARQMLSILDSEFTRVSGELGCNAQERVVAVAQSRAAY